jgi:hypothetical protein
MNYTQKDQEKRASARTVRLEGRAALRLVTNVERCHDCGWETLGSGVEFRKTAEGVVGLAGLVSCGRIWLCPVCNAKVMAKRAIEIGLALAWASTKDMHVIWGSLTVRHHASSDLRALISLQRRAWEGLVLSKNWRRKSATLTVSHVCDEVCPLDCTRQRDVIDSMSAGRVGYIRASEITIGVNGWHPHFHPMIIWRGTKESAQAFADWTTARWVEEVKILGGDANLDGGQQLRVLSSAESFDALSGYVTKQTYDGTALALEMVWSQGKGARPGKRVASTVPHWALLHDIDNGEYSAVVRWEELETAVIGHRMISWSRGLRSFAALGSETSDENIVAAELGTSEDSVCFLTTDGWQKLRDLPTVLGLMLSTLETDGWAGLRVLLDYYDVEYSTLVLSD